MRSSSGAPRPGRAARARTQPATVNPDRPPPAGEDAVGHAAALDVSPPVTPNLVRSREIPGARQIGRNTLETLLFRGLSTPVALLLVVLQGRFLEPSGRGTFVLAVLTVTILSRLFGQLGVAVTNRLGEGEVDARSLVHRALAIAVLVGSLGMVFVSGWAWLTGDIDPGDAAVASLALIPNIVWQTISGVLLGLARVRFWNYIQLLSPVATLVGMLVLVVALDTGVRGALAAWAGANLVTALFALAGARDLWLPLRLPRILDRHAQTLVRLALLLGAVQVVNLVSYRIELFILRSYGTLEDVGIYSIAMQAAESMWLVPAALATAVTAPAVHDSEQRAAALVARTAVRGLLLTAAIAVVVGLAAPFAIPLALGDDFSGAATSLAFLLPGVVAYAPVTILTVYLSVRLGRPRLSLAVSVLALIVTTLAALVLIPELGRRGAAIGSTLGYVAGGILAWMFFVRLAGLRWTGRARSAAAAS